MKRVAILLHLSSIQALGEFRYAVEHIDADTDLFINLVDQGGSPAALAEQLVGINRALDDAAIIYSDGRGGEVGGLFQLLNEIKGIPYQAVLFLHDQLHRTERRSMLRALATNSAEYIELLSGSKERSMGLIGRKLFPFDYQYISAYSHLANRLGIKLKTDWEPLLQRFPELESMDITQRTRWAVTRRIKTGRPELDLEYAESVIADNIEQASDEDRAAMQRKLIAHGVMGPLPWFPDMCFWINPALTELLAGKIDYLSEYNALPHASANWLSHTGRVPAWARLLPVFSIKNNLMIAEID